MSSCDAIMNKYPHVLQKSRFLRFDKAHCSGENSNFFLDFDCTSVILATLIITFVIDLVVRVCGISEFGNISIHGKTNPDPKKNGLWFKK